MNPAWMSTFLFLAPVQWMQEVPVINMCKKNNSQTTEKPSHGPCAVLQQEQELCSQTAVSRKTRHALETAPSQQPILLSVEVLALLHIDAQNCKEHTYIEDKL
jgi:hypothetical protein